MLGILSKSLMFLAASIMWAQPSDHTAEPIFPSDGKNPRQVNGAKLLETVCPGNVVTGKEIECRTGCPESTSFGSIGDHDFEWSLGAVTQGHFLSPTSYDAVLWMQGCEPHSANFGGTVLLTRRSQQWMMLWYQGGIET